MNAAAWDRISHNLTLLNTNCHDQGTMPSQLCRMARLRTALGIRINRVIEVANDYDLESNLLGNPAPQIADCDDEKGSCLEVPPCGDTRQ